MTPNGITIEQLRLTRPTLGDIGAVAARAFHHDPFFIHLTARPLLRARGLGLFWRSSVAAVGDRGEVYGARQSDGRLVGVAVWIKPGQYPLPVGAQLRQGVGAFWGLAPRPPSLVSGTKYLLAIDKAHPHEPLWYLELLVVDPSVQRSGIGGSLQEQVLPKADADGLDCYLETQNADNLPYYRRFGYETVAELHPVKDGPPLWTMRRAARVPSG
jgi:GNAT superfamily N-acetyltransferase